MTFKNKFKKKELRLAVGIVVVLAVFASGVLASDILFNKIYPPGAIEIQCEKLETQKVLAELKKYGIIVEENTDFPDFLRWVRGAKEAASLLPPDVLFEITSQKNYLNSYCLIIEFVELDKWYTGRYDFWENKIKINITPDPEHPFPFEYISENGYGKEEIVYVFLHEMGHGWDWGSRGESLVSFSETYKGILEKEKSPSLYPYYHHNEEGKLEKRDEINEIEDFAESFAHYVFLPEYLKKNFPLRYEWFNTNVFSGVEYDESTPSSIVARLTEPLP